MDDLSDLIRPAATGHRLSAASRKALFHQLAALAADTYGLDAKVAENALAEREKIGSTAFGAGIAIPHARIDGLDAIHGVIATLAKPLDLAAVDDLPVDLVVALFSPSDAGQDHLKALARVSRALRDSALVAKLRGAASRDAMYVLIAGQSVNDAG
ncbi:MAG: PTS sugar transporter subunit IIA [Sphingomonas sp.]|uniref:PTS sugar transporter subunit IIA n=1 Tax=Sphingomonas sp. TaxID=28214 RepID=UPI001AC5CFE2|nr:PTS sugar transporter subunit IIA [Sphingomonas sp.]MBN8809058.1 PTS sugar transporter subunit IIA [Sphingomonas sp.]